MLILTASKVCITRAAVNENVCENSHTEHGQPPAGWVPIQMKLEYTPVA